MNRAEQRQLIITISNKIRDGLLDQIDKIPEDWNGFELRQAIEDSAAEANYVKMPAPRMRSYKKAVRDRRIRL